MTITTTPASISVDTRVRITSAKIDHLKSSRFIDCEGVVTGILDNRAPVSYRVRLDDADLEEKNIGTWTADALEVVGQVKDEAPARPMINFTDEGVNRATARAYAEDMISKTLSEDHNAILACVAAGSPAIDAYSLNEALLAAMRSGSTRFGASMARRDFGRKVAYLGHIVQAVLEAHADGLPTYETGRARSRRVQELSLEVEHAGLVNQSLTRDLTEARETVQIVGRQGEQDRAKVEELRNEIGMLKEAASEERRRLCAEIDALKAKNAADSRSADIFSSVIVYAFEGMNSQQKARVLGYWDAQNES